MTEKMGLQEELADELRNVVAAIEDLEAAIHHEAAEARKKIDESTRTVEQLGIDLSR